MRTFLSIIVGTAISCTALAADADQATAPGGTSKLSLNKALSDSPYNPCAFLHTNSPMTKTSDGVDQKSENAFVRSLVIDTKYICIIEHPVNKLASGKDSVQSKDKTKWVINRAGEIMQFDSNMEAEYYRKVLYENLLVIDPSQELHQISSSSIVIVRNTTVWAPTWSTTVETGAKTWSTTVSANSYGHEVVFESDVTLNFINETEVETIRLPAHELAEALRVISNFN